MPAGAEILLVEPFYGGSHKQLLDLLAEELPHCETVTLPAKKWHWRARTSAIYLAQVIPRKSTTYRTLFASSVLNLAELVALRPDLRDSHKILYFHEHQLAYPVRKQQERDFQYGYNQIISCLVADSILFNSGYCMESFLTSIASFMKLIPDHRPVNLEAQIKPKCKVLYFPIVFPNLKELADSDCHPRIMKNNYLEGGSSDVIYKKVTRDGSSYNESLTPTETIGLHTPHSGGLEGINSSQMLQESTCNKGCFNSAKDRGDEIGEFDAKSSHICSETCDKIVETSEQSFCSVTCGNVNSDADEGDKSGEHEAKLSNISQNIDDSLVSSGLTYCSVSQVVEELTPATHAGESMKTSSEPVLHIVWPHRWEHDKNPELFFSTLYKLADMGLDFRLSVLGEQFSDWPKIFHEAHERLTKHISNWGYQASKRDYYTILTEADVVVSTADHEFFGVAMLEAVHCGCYPLCPNKLAYPEIFPKEYLYNTSQQLFKRLREFCRHPHLVRKHSVKVDTKLYSWEQLKPEFLACFSSDGQRE